MEPPVTLHCCLFTQNNNGDHCSIAVSLMIVMFSFAASNWRAETQTYYCLFHFPSLLPASPYCPTSPTLSAFLLPLKVCVCSVGSPVPVHYPTSLHNDPRVLPEPVASLRASHCSPVFYLLDNGKRRDISDLGLSIIICFIRHGIIALTCNLWTAIVQCCPMHASCTFLHPEKEITQELLLAGVGWHGRGGQEEGLFSFSTRFQSQSPSTCLLTTLLALQTCWKWLPSLSFTALAMRSMRVCRWLPPLFVCPRLSAGGVTSSAACVRSWLWGLEEEGIVFQMSTFRP